MCKLPVDPEGEGIIMEGREANPAWFHGVCRNAERYLWKQAEDLDKLRGRDDKSSTAVDTLKKLKDSPKEYEHKVLSLVVTGKVRRGKEDKVKAIKVLEDLIYETSVAEQEEVMFLHKFAFVKHMKEQEGHTSDDARDEWDACLADPDIRKHKDRRGRDCLPVEMPFKIIARRAALKRKSMGQALFGI